MSIRPGSVAAETQAASSQRICLDTCDTLLIPGLRAFLTRQVQIIHDLIMAGHRLVSVISEFRAVRAASVGAGVTAVIFPAGAEMPPPARIA
jgi:hypothetical protein